MARVLSFDYGTKRIGIAVTDPMQIIASGLDVIHPDKVFEFIKNYLQQEEVERFVVGEAKDMRGNDSRSMSHIKGFVRKLEREFPEIPITMIDERFTSKIAKDSILSLGLSKSKRSNKELVDKVSATIILQSYLETQQ
ncbi:MAG: putative Holliday junction resolvase [Sphingobacteriales bacterium]|jgi:putative Holliday junction resolvase